MRRLFVLLLTAVVLLVGSPAHADDETAVRPTPYGTWVLDPDGRVLLMHGVNMVYKLDPYAPDEIGFDRGDAQFLARQGFTTVRLGLIWKAVEPKPGKYDDRYLKRIAATARILADAGIWTMLDFHQDLYHERFQGEGAPDWAVLDNGLPAMPQLGFPYNYFAMPGLNASFDNFWNNTEGPGGVGLQDRYAAAWAHVVKTFRGVPRILGIDVFNEPWPGNGWQLCANTVGCPLFDAKLESFTQKVVDAVRAVDTRTPIFYEPHVLFNNGVPTFVRPKGKNLAFSFHDYCLTADAGLGEAGLPDLGGSPDTDPPCSAFDNLVWDSMTGHVADTGHPPLLTEFGATDNQRVIRDMVTRAQRALTGWQYWAYCGCSDPTTTGPGATQALVLDPAEPPTGKNVDHRKLRSLVVPHPLAVSGTPLWARFNRESKVFRARWTTKRAAGGGRFGAGSRTTISVPRVVYAGGGYEVDVIGGRVVSGLRARRVVVVQDKGVTEMRVRVRPGPVVSDPDPIQGRTQPTRSTIASR